ncbi:MAG: cation transporter [Sandaracinaceae bacterium]|nr:cation transporter [Sandaracinaceae bacterium]
MAHGHAHAHEAHAHAEHGHGHASKIATPRGALTVALALTVSFMIVEVVVGFWSGSLALLADAGHMLNDAAALALSLVVTWIAARPRTANHHLRLPPRRGDGRDGQRGRPRRGGRAHRLGRRSSASRPRSRSAASGCS